MSRKPGEHKPTIPTRLMKEFQLSGRSQEQLLGTSLGRTVLHGWGRSFTQAFREVMPPSVRLHTQLEPGVVYLSGEELMQLPEYVYKRRGNGSIDAVASVSAVVAELCSEEVLDRVAARQKQRVHFQGFGLRGIKATGLQVIARVQDLPSEFYEGGYLLAGERAAVGGGSQEIISADVVLGTVEADDGNFRTELLSGLKYSMAQKIVLSGMESVRL